MDVAPLLPPYAHVTQEAVQCAALASSRYQVPELLIHAILVKENGRMGQCSPNKGGKPPDCGLAQINAAWGPEFAKWGVTMSHIAYDTCTNLYASAYIVRKMYNKKNDWFQAIVSYNIGPNNWTPTRYSIGYKYARDVVRQWWAFQRYVEARGAVAPSSGVVESTPAS